MSSQSKKRPVNKGSMLLTDQENDALFRLLSDRNGQKYTLASGVVQLLAAEPTRRREWQKKFVGVVCFIKDYAEKGYFLRLYDITKNSANALLWEQSFYDGFYVDQKAHLNAPELVTFEGDDCVYGLNFSSASEANEFTRQVNRRFEQEQKSKSRSSVGQPSNPPISSTTSQNIVAPSPILNFGNGSSGGKSSKKKKGKLTKNDISLPTNFEHRVHVGWDPGQGFRTEASSREDLDPQIKMLLDKIGMPTNIGKKNIKMVYDIIDQHGGMEALKNELSQPPPPPSRSPPQVPTAPYSGQSRNDNRPAQPKARDLPPPPPIMTNNSRPLPQPPSIPPQPPPGRPGPPAPPNPPALGNKNVSAPHPPPPPPPPPPPLAGAHIAAPPPPPPPPPPVVSGGGGSNLLAEIAQGISLKPVQSNEGIHTSRSSDSRDAIMNDIKGGINLRPVDRQERQRITPPEEMGGIAGALARALQDRRFQISDDTDSDDDNDDEEEDEWDD